MISVDSLPNLNRSHLTLEKRAIKEWVTLETSLIIDTLRPPHRKLFTVQHNVAKAKCQHSFHTKNSRLRARRSLHLKQYQQPSLGVKISLEAPYFGGIPTQFLGQRWHEERRFKSFVDKWRWSTYLVSGARAHTTKRSPDRLWKGGSGGDRALEPASGLSLCRRLALIHNSRVRSHEKEPLW
jgi:hypothetical protein